MTLTEDLILVVVLTFEDLLIGKLQYHPDQSRVTHFQKVVPMSISSRTPEGESFRCDICGEVARVEASDTGDTLCPACGQLLWRIKLLFAEQLNVPADQIGVDEIEQDMAEDSMDAVEIVMTLEEEFEEFMLEFDLDQVHSIREVVALIRKTSATAWR